MRSSAIKTIFSPYNAELSERKNVSLQDLTSRDFYRILQLESPKDVLIEVQTILSRISPAINIPSVIYAFLATINLFQGRYTGYLACNTNYHDLCHTVDTFLAVARLIDGAALNGIQFKAHDIVVSLKAALLHDAGYIQEYFDQEGTGAKYTVSHVRRSMNFFERHKAELGLSDSDVIAGQLMILCTKIDENIDNINFPDNNIELLGRILGTADLISQLADRMYLEKLLLLYHEFQEGNIGDYQNEEDLLRKTLSFIDMAIERTQLLLKDNDLFLRLHFDSRWNLNSNLYAISIDKQKTYLKQILKLPDGSLLKHLKRGRIAAKILTKAASGEG